MRANISFFSSLLNDGSCSVCNSELLSFLKDYAEKSTGAMLCNQWLDSIRDRTDVTADLTARLSNSSHDYDKERISAATKLKEQMMDENTMLDQEDNEYIRSLDGTVQQQITTMLQNVWRERQATLLAQLQQGAPLGELVGEGAHAAPVVPVVPATRSPLVAPSVPAQGPPMMANDVASVEY